MFDLYTGVYFFLLKCLASFLQSAVAKNILNEKRKAASLDVDSNHKSF